MVSGLVVGFGAVALAAEAAAPPRNSSTESQASTAYDPLVIPPPLSKPRLDYYRAHPGEYRQLLVRLPARRLAPVPRPPATAAWQPVTASAPVVGIGAPMLMTDGTVIVHKSCTKYWHKLTPDNTGS